MKDFIMNLLLRHKKRKWIGKEVYGTIEKKNWWAYRDTDHGIVTDVIPRKEKWGFVYILQTDGFAKVPSLPTGMIRTLWVRLAK